MKARNEVEGKAYPWPSLMVCGFGYDAAKRIVWDYVRKEGLPRATRGPARTGPVKFRGKRPRPRSL